MKQSYVLPEKNRYGWLREESKEIRDGQVGVRSTIFRVSKEV